MSTGDATVLIVEDDLVFRQVLAYTISRCGAKVITASNGLEGFDLAVAGGLDFLVTDLQMPGASGLQMLERLDSVPGYRRPPTILCTAKGLEFDTSKCRDQFQLVAVLRKPFSPRNLLELIQKTISTHTTIPSIQDVLSTSGGVPLHV